MAAFDKVLVANRGEIAVRICRTLRELGMRSVAVYSEADRHALHVAYADEAFLVGPSPAAESYLRVDRIVDTARRAGAGAVHPGYGFLAESAAFARAVEEAGLVWIGPPPAAIELMGEKTRARRAMAAAGVPIVPGTTEPLSSIEELLAAGESIGYPLLIKAAAGGGGKGMEEVHGPADASRAFATAQRQGRSYFGDDAVYVERLLVDPRHVEVQVIADAHGNVIHLGERDCTIQRRHQKLVEETPSPAVDADLRERLGGIGVAAARAAGYRSAGTVEGLLTADGEYFFMEMNTRIQVEHTVTELVTGLDLVREQVRVALGEPLSLTQDDVGLRGHAIECRINAEDPALGFLPSPGVITAYREPSGPGVRVDSGVEEGSEVSGVYDPLIAKLVVHGEDREHARHRMLRALGEFVIEGPATLLPFHRALLAHECFIRADTCAGALESGLLTIGGAESDGKSPTSLPHEVERVSVVELDGRRSELRTFEPEPAWRELARRRKTRRASHHASGAHDAVVSPMQGTVLAVPVSEDDLVEAGAVICIVEAMKMENEVRAPRAGRVTGLSVRAGEPVTTGQVICVLEAE